MTRRESQEEVMVDLRKTVRECVARLDAGDERNAASCVEPIRVALRERGLAPGCHVGRKDMVDGSEECLEWYAGQILDIVDGQYWHCVNSITNCVDRFAPEAG